MSHIQTLTQTGLRLELVSLEMRSLVDRSVKSSLLHEIVEYCVPRRLLRSFYVWGMRGSDALMRLVVEIDYDEHDRQIKLAGDCLPDGVAGNYAVVSGPDHTGLSGQNQRFGCPHVGKAVDLFVKVARERGLYLSWNVSFCNRHAELYKKFGFRTGGSSTFRDLTSGTPSARVVHSMFSELSVSARVSQDIADSDAPAPDYERRQAQPM